VASPQKENGFTAIANEVMDAFCHIRIPGEERQILDSILRKTYGWNKSGDAIALSQFVEMTGLKKPAVVRAINGLLSKKIIVVIEKDNVPAKVYKFNKDFEQWKPLSKKITLSKKIMSVIKKDKASLSKKSTTKTTTTKDTITKDKYSVDFLLFYNSYPNRKEKEHTFKCWKKLNGKRPPIETILVAIKKQIEWRENANGDFRPEWKHPATWLNKGCWDDELTPTASQSKTQIDGGRVIPKSHHCHNCKQDFTDYNDYLRHDCREEMRE
jgi:phage replication O-like protein O